MLGQHGSNKYIAQIQPIIDYQYSFRRKHVIRAQEVKNINAVFENSKCCPTLFLFFTADMTNIHNMNLAVFADNRVILWSVFDFQIASLSRTPSITSTENWPAMWTSKQQQIGAIHLLFSKEPVYPWRSATNAYQWRTMWKLGLYLERRLIWETHSVMKRRQLNVLEKASGIKLLVNPSPDPLGCIASTSGAISSKPLCSRDHHRDSSRGLYASCTETWLMSHSTCQIRLSDQVIALTWESYWTPWHSYLGPLSTNCIALAASDKILKETTAAASFYRF